MQVAYFRIAKLMIRNALNKRKGNKRKEINKEKMDRFRRRLAERKKKKLFNRVNTNFEIVYRTCRDISAHYGNYKSVNIAVLKTVTEMAKVKLDGNPQEVEFYLKVNSVLDGIYATCHKKAKKMKGDSISLAFLRHCIDVVHQNFGESYKHNQEIIAK